MWMDERDEIDVESLRRTLEAMRKDPGGRIIRLSTGPDVAWGSIEQGGKVLDARIGPGRPPLKWPV